MTTTLNRKKRFQTIGDRMKILLPFAKWGVFARLIFGCLLLLPGHSYALGQERYVMTERGEGGFGIVQGKVAAGIYVETNDYPGVIRATGDLRADVLRVSACAPKIFHDTTHPEIGRASWRERGEISVVGVSLKK